MIKRIIIGDTIASFQMSGKIPSSMEELKIVASGLDNISTASLINLTEI